MRAAEASPCTAALQSVWLHAGGAKDEQLLARLCASPAWGAQRFGVAARLLTLHTPVSEQAKVELKRASLALVDAGDPSALPYACELLAAVLLTAEAAKSAAEAEDVVDRVWVAWRDAKRKPARAAGAVFALLLHPLCWRLQAASGEALALRHWAAAADHATRSARTATALVAAACSAWSADLVLTAQRFLPCVVDAAQLVHNTEPAGDDEDVHAKSAALLFGTWLEGLPHTDASTRFACALADALLAALCSAPLVEREYSPAASTNARKVSLWRALCVLAPRLGAAESVRTHMWAALRLKNHPNVRQLMQLFIAAVLLTVPRWAEADLLTQLHEPNHEYQYAASLAMITADVLAWLPPAEQALSLALFQALLPLTLHFHHAVRVAAQTVVHLALAAREQLRKSHPALNAMYLYLDGNQVRY